MAAPDSNDRVVLGIDFGTTFSGIAYSYSATPDRPDDINIIQTWPGGSAYTSDKVPSELAYTSSEPTPRASVVSPGGRPTDNVFNLLALNAATNGANHRPASAGQIRWGFQLRPGDSRLRCLKLFLESGQQMPSFVSQSDMQEQLRRSGKDAVTAVGDYLTELVKHARDTLTRRYGELFISTTRLEFVLTVPAIWSDDAKDATLRAARKAGMENIRMISEPEAAAVYTLQAIQPNHLRVGDNFIVCDAGGGTVDLISYEITSKDPIRIQETVRGTGACCGAAFLNIKFEEYVRAKVGNTAFRSILDRQPKSWSAAMKFFEEYVKRNFDPTDPVEFNIPFPGIPDNTDAEIEQGFLTMSSDAVSSLFNPIVGDIIGLVKQQMRALEERSKPIRAIVLVGGFGQSNCLYKCLHAHFAIPEPPPPYPGSTSSSSDGTEARLEIMQPTNAWTAVARGAVLRGLEGAEIVLSRKSRRHYGINSSTPFDDRVHDMKDRYWDDFTQKWKANNQMRWYIRKDQECSSTEPIRFSFHCHRWSVSRSAKSATLLVCDQDVAPVVYNAEHGLVKGLCTLVVDLNQVPARLWETRTNSKGSTYYRLEYELGMQIESGILRFDLLLEGVVYGGATAEFN